MSNDGPDKISAMFERLQEQTIFRRVYRYKSEIPKKPVTLYLGIDRRINLMHGPLRFPGRQPERKGDGGADYFEFSFDGGSEVRLPERTYLVIDVFLRNSSSSAERHRISQVADESVALAEVLFPNVLGERFFEGFVSPSGGRQWNDYPVTIRSTRPPRVMELSQAYSEHFAALQKVPASVRDRYALCSRWFIRGLAQENPVERFLHFYLVLEIWPLKQKRTNEDGSERPENWPEAMSRYVRDNLYQELSAKEVRSRLKLSRIGKYRGKILHWGQAYFDEAKAHEVMQLIKIQHDLILTCMKLLIGVNPGYHLDKYLEE